MENLGPILQVLHPTADPLRDFRVQDDGKGPFIAHWNEAKLGPQPTLAELQAAEPAAMAKHEARRKIAEAEAQITPRRLREAVLTQAGRDWLAAQEEKIKGERGKL